MMTPLFRLNTGDEKVIVKPENLVKEIKLRSIHAREENGMVGPKFHSFGVVVIKNTLWMAGYSKD